METEIQEEIALGLVKEFKVIRDDINKMIDDLEVNSAKITAIFPTELKSNFKWIFEQRVNTMTEIFKTLLEMRKELNKSLKDEIDIRRKIGKGVKDIEEGIEEILDIRKIAKKVEAFQKKTRKIKEKVEAKIQDEVIEVKSQEA